MVKFPCGICQKEVKSKHKAICCDLCDQWIHISCNKLTKTDYNKMMNSNLLWFCKKCLKKELPFNSITNQEFNKIYDSKYATAFQKVTPDFKEKAAHLAKEQTNNILNCSYYDLSDLNKINTKDNKYFSLFHLNISSLPYHFEEIEELLDQMKIKPEIIGISESRIYKDKEPLTNICLKNYNIEQTKTESSKGGTLLYISESLNYKKRNDLKIYKTKELESTFVEIINKKGKNTIVGCIYKHPTMPTYEFDSFLEPLYETLTKENKDIYLLGDFNVNLLNYESDNQTASFLDKICSNGFFPYINIPTRITLKSKTLIDNIFLNNVVENTISGNITTDISDHLAQFLLIPIKIQNKAKPLNAYQRDYKNFDIEIFQQDLQQIHWPNILSLNKNDVNYSFEQFLSSVNNILDHHAPYKHVSRKQLKTAAKPWITKGIRKSIHVKNMLHHKFCKSKDEERKAELHSRYKTYKNLLVKLTRKSKDSHYKKFFEENKCFKSLAGNKITY